MRIAAGKHPNVDKKGMVWRQSSVLKVWKECHIVVTKDSLMYWYTSPSDAYPEEVIALKKATGVRRQEGGPRPHSFILSGKGVVYPFAANSEEDMEAWLRTIGKGIVRATTTEWDETSDRLAEQQAQGEERAEEGAQGDQ
mmetsp:Transcript_2877/g.6533  ORF Transcript_2877/g.6533 Transcript_2877/m.6533 type:complete len:140 (+) Transcript_2877:77-496(+)